MKKTLPARPNLDHLRRQAKILLTRLKEGEPQAARAFIDFLPEAKKLTPAAVPAAGFRLADAQSVVAHQTGFVNWPALSRHVQHLRALEGEWRFVSLEIDGSPVPRPMTAESRLLIDGDRFRTESPDANYEGVFTIDVEAKPAHIDIEFVEGPEAGNWSFGLYALDRDRLTMCLGLVGSARPKAFATSKGSGHALERLRRASSARPANVPGGTPPPAAASTEPRERADSSAFNVPMTPMLKRLEGEWAPVELVMDGKPMPAQWLAFGSRTAVGNEVTVTFGGQTMVHAKVRIDERAAPIAIDYLNVSGRQAGTVSLGIMEWIGDEVRFLIAGPGEARPEDFSVPGSSTLSRWRRR